MRECTSEIEIDPRTAVVLERKTNPSVDIDDDDELGPDDLADKSLNETSRAARALAVEDGQETPVGGIPGQIHGYWYDALDKIPKRRPPTASAAVLPQEEELGTAGLALFLVEHEGEWAPISEFGENVVTQAMKQGQPRFFVVAADWPTTYAARLHAQVDADDLSEHYDELASERARGDAKTLVLRLERVQAASPIVEAG